MLSGIKVAVLGPPGKHLALLRGHTYWGGVHVSLLFELFQGS